jgi:hypothetical protein
MKKRASDLVAGDVINRFGNACKIVAVKPSIHQIGGEVVTVTHTNGINSASLSFKPSHLVEMSS